LSTFQKLDFESKGIRGNRVNSVTEDEVGNLLVGTEKGLSYFNYKTEQFEQPSFAGITKQLLYEGVDDVTIDRQGDIWFAVYNVGVFHFDVQKETFNLYSKDKDSFNLIGSDNVRKIYEDTRGGIWLISFGTINYKPSGTDRFRIIEHNADKLMGIAEDQAGNIFIPTTKGFC